MRRSSLLLFTTSALLAALAIVPRSVTEANTRAPASNATEFYTTKVQPIFRANCYRCHSGLNHRGGLRTDTREALMRGGKDGVVIVPGHPEQSLLIKLIRHKGPPKDPMPMPPKSKLSDSDIAVITQWVQDGAAMPEEAKSSE